ncbi:MAG: ElyC/SanA/YdcF family protein [Bifidobacterium scardovii]|uniref:ElyC/SanA/YdcF family protein n=1 Tax=Bifidobacterium scardovii TaxID=158787 RepID=UPI002904B1CD|nr:ElyC/SanA/YdcF family protein [Bifidobacterium scardovii]MDU2422001.1 ElyC/SanA/YdcF family protein [Bifidobacterium scardovii]
MMSVAQRDERGSGVTVPGAEGLGRVADAINALGAFCGPRDVPRLTRRALSGAIGDGRADVMVLFGGSILHGVDVLADAIRNGAARHYVIVGGAGHTTQTLRDIVRGRYPGIAVEGEPEARIFEAVLRERHGLGVDWLETASTNCGNNITNMLELLRERDPGCRSVILSQDATMQRRMAAGLRRFAPDVAAVNYATYHVRVVVRDGRLAYESEPEGMWPVARYVSLLMGEVARLRDDADGYGPSGKGYIAHVDVPYGVENAAAVVSSAFGDVTREANPAFASK